MSTKFIRISHVKSGELIAEGRKGWEIMPFEGNYYIRNSNLISNGFKINFIPGLCVYKFFYVWLNYTAPDGKIIRNLGWKYWLPNPLLPFIWFRVAVPAGHPEIKIEELEQLN